MLMILLFFSAFDVSTPEKLYSALQRFTPQAPIQVSIARFLTGWTTQPGYPVVTITRNNATHVTVSQQRFLLQNRQHTDQTRWEIPLTFATSEEPNFASTSARFLLSSTMPSTTIQLNAGKNWTIFNVQQTGKFCT